MSTLFVLTCLLNGKQVSGLSNSEEIAVGLTDLVPFLLEDELKKRGRGCAGAAKRIISIAMMLEPSPMPLSPDRDVSVLLINV